MPTVIIYWSPGRDQSQKQQVISEITETLVSAANARREDVLIIFQEIQPGDAGRAGLMVGAPKAEPTPTGPNSTHLTHDAAG